MGKTRDTFGHLFISNIYPLEDGKADMDNLGTVGLRFNHDETKKFIEILQCALDNENRWDYLDITGFRKTNQVTITHYIPVRNRTEQD